MTWVQFGNANAREAYRDPASDDPELLRYRPLEGRQITCAIFPDDLALLDQFRTAVAIVDQHFAHDDDDQTIAPTWVESDSSALEAILVEHYRIKNNHKPKAAGDHPEVARLKGPEGEG